MIFYFKLIKILQHNNGIHEGLLGKQLILV